MAQEALRDLSVFDACDLHRHHLKVHHRVARWGLVALRAVGGSRWRVAELRDGPRCGPVTLGAIRTEQLPVAILVTVAGVAVHGSFAQGDGGVGRGRRGASLHESGEALGRGARARITCGRTVELPPAQTYEQRMIHPRRPLLDPLMLDVAHGARGHISMKPRRLPLQQRLVVGMTRDAVHRLHPAHGGVAGGAVVLQKGMRLGQRTRAGQALPGHRVQQARSLAAGVAAQEEKPGHSTPAKTTAVNMTRQRLMTTT